MARHPKTTPADLANKARGERLQKVLAEAGVASRRACEELIARGAVEVNGDIITDLPVWVDPEIDRIVVDGHPISRTRPRNTYILLNKPDKTLCTVEDEPGAGRRTVIDLVEHPAAPRLFPVGRLDYDTVGLVLLTNDGDLANRLTHPRYGVPKTYRVKIKGRLEANDVKQIEDGIYLADRTAGKTEGASRTSRVEIAVTRSERDSTWLEITLREGRNRQVRRMLAAVGYPVKSLERIAMGPLRLKGVARGLWRELTAAEVRALRRAAAAPVEEGSKARSADRGDRPTRNSPKQSQTEFAPGSEKSGLKRRTIKNAVNRAGREGRPRG